jgi:predicted membrane protein
MTLCFKKAIHWIHENQIGEAMENKETFHPSSQLVIGLLIIFLGVIFTLGNLDLMDSYNIVRFWPIALIALGLYIAATGGELPGRFTGILVCVVGLLLLSNNLGYLHLGFWDFWPLVLVLVGVNMVWLALQSRIQSEDSSKTINGIAVLGGFNKACHSSDFRGGELTALMGGGEIDLRQASIEGDQATLNVHALMGGYKIYVPADWMVTCKIFPFMGGVEDKTSAPPSGSEKKLLLRGFAIMGGVEIHN